MQSMQPSFRPRINSPTTLYEKKSSALGLAGKDWIAKSHLQRLAEDLERRKENLEKKMQGKQQLEETTRGEKFAANWKSENYLYF